mmetsp:Transcript_75815/g.214358  ORF Transcript_75815/g.214358 Transcript_75815/m.214358 type:complete len:221 (+) Transcript_75815:697-1359(+)
MLAQPCTVQHQAGGLRRGRAARDGGPGDRAEELQGAVPPGGGPHVLRRPPGEPRRPPRGLAARPQERGGARQPAGVQGQDRPVPRVGQDRLRRDVRKDAGAADHRPGQGQADQGLADVPDRRRLAPAHEAPALQRHRAPHRRELPGAVHGRAGTREVQAAPALQEDPAPQGRPQEHPGGWGHRELRRHRRGVHLRTHLRGRGVRRHPPQARPALHVEQRP